MLLNMLSKYRSFLAKIWAWSFCKFMTNVQQLRFTATRKQILPNYFVWIAKIVPTSFVGLRYLRENELRLSVTVVSLKCSKVLNSKLIIHSHHNYVLSHLCIEENLWMAVSIAGFIIAWDEFPKYWHFVSLPFSEFSIDNLEIPTVTLILTWVLVNLVTREQTITKTNQIS